MTAGKSGFLGTALWGFSAGNLLSNEATYENVKFSAEMAYPEGSDNIFYPSTPFDNPAEFAWLAANL